MPSTCPSCTGASDTTSRPSRPTRPARNATSGSSPRPARSPHLACPRWGFRRRRTCITSKTSDHVRPGGCGQVRAVAQVLVGPPTSDSHHFGGFWPRPPRRMWSELCGSAGPRRRSPMVLFEDPWPRPPWRMWTGTKAVAQVLGRTSPIRIHFEDPWPRPPWRMWTDRPAPQVSSGPTDSHCQPTCPGSGYSPAERCRLLGRYCVVKGYKS